MERVRQIIEGLGLQVATPAEAREILALKGGDDADCREDRLHSGGQKTKPPVARSTPYQDRAQKVRSAQNINRLENSDFF